MGKLKALPRNQDANSALKQLSQEKPRAKSYDQPYNTFDQLDGTHPWQTIVPEGQISYQVRQLKSGKMAYFNFKLAKEMGLIPKDHPENLNKKLEQKVIDTFCLRIINEYDIENKIYYDKNTIKPNKYMATRYLQLQHTNKKGETSGDGRCIWNGTVVNKGVTWDVSSRGTGVTALAPGAVQAGEPLRSGNEDFGYGCGLAEIDELYSAAIMAEILHLNGVNTERVLTVIDIGGGIGIGVRASKNLLRPAHLFIYLKQENYDALKRGTDYLILRQLHNKEWDFSYKSNKKYELMLEHIASDFAKFTALLDREYIFAWLDWDGDNVLATAGIIDYGSVRQFGLRHDQYRYDDVDRFSTNLNEQRSKARLTVQVFIQLADYLQTKDKKTLNTFKDHPILKKFDTIVDVELINLFLKQCGFKTQHRQMLITKHFDIVKEFYDTYLLIEKIKTYKKQERVADGINRPAIVNARKLIKLVNGHYSGKSQVGEDESNEISFVELFNLVLAKQASAKDSKLSAGTSAKLRKFINLYGEIVRKLTTDKNQKLFYQSLFARSQKLNNDDRVTGNALLYIVNEILVQRKRGLKHKEIQKVIDNFIESQVYITPESNPPKKKVLSDNRSKNLMDVMIDIAKSHNEDI